MLIPAMIRVEALLMLGKWETQEYKCTFAVDVVY